jgi:trans-aconitate methyltransferase
MEQKDAMKLIKRGGSGKSAQHWADLGCGGGTFTTALAGVLPWNSYIHAVDKDQQHLPARINEVSIGFDRLNFASDALGWNDMDGILMSNSLHYVRDKPKLFKRLEDCFRAERRFIVVEYERRWPSPWVPYPLPYLKLTDLAKGYQVTKLAEFASKFGGMIYSALLFSDAAASARP